MQGDGKKKEGDKGQGRKKDRKKESYGRRRWDWPEALMEMKVGRRSRDGRRRVK